MNKVNEKGCKITIKGKDALDSLYKKTGVIRVEILGRTMEWLARQDETLQAIILGQITEDDELRVLDMIKSRLAANADVEDAVRDVAKENRRSRQKRNPSKSA